MQHQPRRGPDDAPFDDDGEAFSEEWWLESVARNELESVPRNEPESTRHLSFTRSRREVVRATINLNANFAARDANARTSTAIGHCPDRDPCRLCRIG